MNETTTLIEKIIEGIQEKKGKQIVVADLNEIEDTICKFYHLPRKFSQSGIGNCGLHQRTCKKRDRH